MKIVFYRILLKRGSNLTIGEKILYSFLVSKSVEFTDCAYDVEGNNLDMDEVYSTLNDYSNHLYLCQINHSKLARELGVTRQNIILSLHKMESLGYINGEMIYVNKELLEGGYFELKIDKGIRGKLLVFYSYLLDKSKKYGYQIDTYKYKLAEDFGATKISITNLLNRLYSLKLAERLDNGLLKIN